MGSNISDPHVIDAVRRFDALVHATVRLFVAESYVYPRENYTLNVIGALHAPEMCRKHGLRLVFVSFFVYCVPRYLPIDERRIFKYLIPTPKAKSLRSNYVNPLFAILHPLDHFAVLQHIRLGTKQQFSDFLDNRISGD
jgi:UDP-glucose 4-epimerase